MSPHLLIGISLAVVGICTLINNAQHENVKQLILFQTSASKVLIANGNYVDGHQAKNTIAKLQKWINESQNYGLLNIITIVVLCSILFIDEKTVASSYIIRFLDGFLLGINAACLPKAITRLYKTIKTNKYYTNVMKKLAIQQTPSKNN